MPSLVQCNIQNAAMQTNLLLMASGIHNLLADNEAATGCLPRKVTQMSKTAAIGFAPSTTLFARLLATIDRLLTSSARIALRNGDLPHFGL
jgi:hypothetical protein